MHSRAASSWAGLRKLLEAHGQCFDLLLFDQACDSAAQLRPIEWCQYRAAQSMRSSTSATVERANISVASTCRWSSNSATRGPPAKRKVSLKPAVTMTPILEPLEVVMALVTTVVPLVNRRVRPSRAPSSRVHDVPRKRSAVIARLFTFGVGVVHPSPVFQG